MEKSIGKLSPQKGSTSSDVTTSLQHGEKSPSGDVSPAKSPENLEKKLLTTEIDIPTALAHDESHETDIVSKDEEEEEINLHLETSDEETFEDTFEDVSELRENKTSALEKYFSDIESSDNSQVYEPKSKGGTSGEAKKAVSNVSKVVKTKVLNKEKSELDFEPVESEEDFEESRSQEETSSMIVEDDSFDTEIQSQVEGESNGALEIGISTKVLSDDEDSKINERNKEENIETTSSGTAVNSGEEPCTLPENEKKAIKDCGQEIKSILEAVDVGDSQTTVHVVESDHIHALSEKTNIPQANDPAGSPTKSSELMEASDDSLIPLVTNEILTNEQKPAEKDEIILQETEKDAAMEVDTGVPSLNVEDNVSAKDNESSSKSIKEDVESQEAMEVDSDLLQTVKEVDSNKKHNTVGDNKQPEAQTSLLNKSVDSTMNLSYDNKPSELHKTVEISIKATADVKDASGDDKSLQIPIQSSTSLEIADVSIDVQASTKRPIQPSKAAEKPEASADLSENENSTETSIPSPNPKEMSEASAEPTENETLTETTIPSSKPVVMSEASAEDSTGNPEFLNKDDKSLETATESPEIQQKSSVTVDVVEKSHENENYLTGAEASLNEIENIPNAGDTSADNKSKKEDSTGDEGNLTNSQQTLETAKYSKNDEECDKVSIGTEELVKSLQESVVTDETFLDTTEITANAEKSDEDLKPPKIDEHPTGTSDILMDTDENSPKAIDASTEDLTDVDKSPKKPEKSLDTVGEDHIDESAKAPESVQSRERNVNDSTKTEKSLDSADEESKRTEEHTSESAENLKTTQIVEENVEDSTKADKSEELDEKVDVAPHKENPLDKCTEYSEKSEELSEKSSYDAPSPITAEKWFEKPTEANTNSSEKPTGGDGEVINETLGNSVQDDGKTEVPKPADAADIQTEKVVAKEMPADSINTFDVPNVKGKPHINEGNRAKSLVSIDPEIIEIDDDDLEDDKKVEPTTASNSKSAPTAGKQDNQLPEVTEVATDKLQPQQDKSLSSAAVPNENPTEKSKGSAEKSTAEAKTVIESAVTQDIEMLETIDDKDKTAILKAPETASAQAPGDEDESLLIIDTSHKEENEPDDNDMDTETEQTATSAPTTTDSSSEGSLEIFYDKECLHYECKHGSKNFYRATLFTLNYYKISKKRNKAQYVCEECYDRALSSYEEMCKTLTKKQPLLHGATFKGQEFVEIIDSSEEDDDDDAADNFKDENALPKDSIELLEAELEGAIRKVMHNVDIQNQLSWTKQILQQRLNNLQEDTEFVSVQLRQLQKKADNMHNSLYQCPKIKIRQLTPLDLNSGRTYNPETESTIPPMGEVLRTSIHVNETYYAVKNKAIASWVPCKVIEAVDNYNPYSKNQKHFKIKFLKSKYPMLKTVSAKHMAFFDPPKVRLPIGTRVIAYFDVTSLSRGKEKMLIPSAFYPGIIAEPLKQSNKFRYLVFYDDGYFQYVYHKDVRLVCQASDNVWEDVHHQSREFIHNYLTQYAVNRPMVQTQKGQSMLVDYNGKWIYARVIDVDCSLVQMLFEGQSRSEWIYRGSTRLGPVYKESNNLVQKNQTNPSRLSRRTEPFIRYINGDDSSSSQQSQEPQPQQSQPKPGEVRAVAKKSVSKIDNSHQSSQPVPTVRHLNNSTIFVDDDNKPKGKVVYYTARKNLPPRDYEQHICSPTCPFNVTHNLSFYSPLAKPLLSGWERQVFRQKSKKFIVYRGPCGKRLRSMEELHRYLRVTENELNVDNFDFSAETNCLAEYVIESCIVQKKDISNGKEKMPIPCVNYYDNTMPPDCIYSSRRIPTEGVPLNLDKDFLVGCDCEDDCSDKTKCSCWELTYAGAKYGMPNVPNEMVGYQYKRLYEHIPTGIYECNARCKCKANCVNRVVQQPLQSKLQVFKTSNRGWGLRCINDVPRGSFICIYAGHLLNEQKANEGGLDAGDEYFAELDYIEVAEQIKEGYESDVVEPDEDEDLYNPDKEDEDDDEFVAPSESHRNRSFNTRSRSRKSTKNGSDIEHDSQERQVISFEPNKTMGQPDNSTSEKPTIRKLFGKDEACYIMDAKITGNLGRYFNHSCSPNLFVQNVFVDTHDLRFPWVAFFAVTHIRAGTELTWNYNYEVGVVPGKVLYCQCGAPNCRQRLL